jgi:hypothetical protein
MDNLKNKMLNNCHASQNKKLEAHFNKNENFKVNKIDCVEMFSLSKY